MKIHKKKINIESKSQIEFIDITNQVEDVISSSGIREGQVLVYSPHTTMSIAVNHNEPMLIRDFVKILYKVSPIDEQYSHDLFELRKDKKTDGRSNGHSHCKTLLLGVSETIPIEKGKLMITEKQAIFAVDFDGARKRELLVQVIGF